MFKVDRVERRRVMRVLLEILKEEQATNAATAPQ